MTLKESAQKAIATNPEVLAKWHNFQSSGAERDAVFGGYLPNVNFIAGVGRDSHENRLTKSDLNRRSGTLSLNQMIYDGFLTSNEVKRFDHMRLVRLYEFYDAAEVVTLEVVRAYMDVIRYRKLVSLSEDNYVRHRAVYEQIQAKSKAGISRRVDLEQISGRVALAEANLLTETSNLHDVSARFQRLVGVSPGKNFETLPTMTKGMPSDIYSAFSAAFSTNPALLASIENIRSVNIGVSSRKAAYQPRLDFKASAERGTNIENLSGRTTNNTAGLQLSWNLFNGLSDKARVQQAADQVNVARDLRDKSCRDIRQTLAIAYNDTKKLAEQLSYLDQHQLSIEKARDAYRQQFDIGQRSLLDLLDTENELFQAKRAFANAEVDLSLAQARTHAGIGSLHSALGLVRQDAEPGSVKVSNTNDEAAQNCPIEAPELYRVDKNALNARASEGLSAISSAPPPAARTEQPAPAEAATPAVTKDAVAVARTSILNSIKGWREAWISMNPDAYLDFYSSKYTSRETWRASRRARLQTAQKISLELSNIQFTMHDAKHATTTFEQAYRSATYQDTLQKTLQWEEIAGKWVIVNETVSGPKAKQW
ncbi:MAG: TolC family outer membrane protein [Undibacterium sp.]|nr:TolC family outer membrane protein [Undibacterium sp.]